jgi:hypothetical protein
MATWQEATQKAIEAQNEFSRMVVSAANVAATTNGTKK